MGLATGLAFAARGLSVHAFDIKPEIRAAVAAGRTPYHEAGLARLLQDQLRAGRFGVVDSVATLAERSEGLFLCVPTPSRPNGEIDLGPLRRSAEEVAEALRPVRGFRLVVVKSTVVPGTTESVVAPIVSERSGRTGAGLGIASNPEFLAEGTMVRDAVEPARIVIGTSDARSRAWLERAYRPFRAPVFALTPSGAELVKYASNSFLALKVSFANEIARLSDRLGVNVDAVIQAVGHDPRIGDRFLKAGPGFGGSCFDKDVRALVHRAEELGDRFRSGDAALRINDDQLAYVLDRVRSAVGPLRGKRIALLGLAFKDGTDDVRESRAIPIAEALFSEGATVRAHDPVAVENFRRAWTPPNGTGAGELVLVATVPEALEGADAAVLQAAWPEYLRWPGAWTRRMRVPLLLDLRRALDRGRARRVGLTVIGLGAGDPAGTPPPRPGASP